MGHQEIHNTRQKIIHAPVKTQLLKFLKKRPLANQAAKNIKHMLFAEANECDIHT